MLLSEILYEDVIKVNLDAEERFEAIEELVDLLIEAHEVPMSYRNHIIDVVTGHERAMSHGMECGIALPHGASDRISDVIGALGLSRKGIPFNCLDGQPARIILLLVTPKQNYQGHVRTLAGIAHLMQNERFREKLLQAPDAATALALITDAEREFVKKSNPTTS